MRTSTDYALDGGLRGNAERLRKSLVESGDRDVGGVELQVVFLVGEQA